VHAFTFAHPDDGWDLRLDLQWCTAAGELLCRDQVQWSHRAPFAVKQALAEGSYLLRAVSHAGRRAEAPFSVVKGGIAAPLHLDLRE
jgi:hypothetical protein